jgi:hypothetical protein
MKLESRYGRTHALPPRPRRKDANITVRSCRRETPELLLTPDFGECHDASFPSPPKHIPTIPRQAGCRNGPAETGHARAGSAPPRLRPAPAQCGKPFSLHRADFRGRTVSRALSESGERETGNVRMAASLIFPTHFSCPLLFDKGERGQAAPSSSPSPRSLFPDPRSPLLSILARTAAPR